MIENSQQESHLGLIEKMRMLAIAGKQGGK
jgi:hypothetical protein